MAKQLLLYVVFCACECVVCCFACSVFTVMPCTISTCSPLDLCELFSHATSSEQSRRKQHQNLQKYLIHGYSRRALSLWVTFSTAMPLSMVGMPRNFSNRTRTERVGTISRSPHLVDVKAMWRKLGRLLPQLRLSAFGK